VPSSDDVTLDSMDGEEELVGSDQTSADYYFDSYAHFGIHEVSLLLCLSHFGPFFCHKLQCCSRQ
jgi:hypothetical protein